MTSSGEDPENEGPDPSAESIQTSPSVLPASRERGFIAIGNRDGFLQICGKGSARLAITRHFCLLGKSTAIRTASGGGNNFMKHTVLLSAIAGMFLPGLLAAQEAAATNAAPSLFSPESPSPSVQPSPEAAASPAGDSNPALQAPDAGTNAPADASTTNAPDAGTNVAAPADPLAPPPDSGMGSPGQNPPASDPNSLIPPPTEPETPSPVNTAANEEKERQDQKSKYYAAKVKADKEEALAGLLEKSDKAKTDEGKRQILREYYDLLARRMKKIDPSISDWVDTMHAAYLRRLEQVRIEPSVPLTPPPSPEATPVKKTEKAAQGEEDEAPRPRRKARSQSADSSPTPAPKGKSSPTSSPKPQAKKASAQD